jgi:hypothetical protein
MSLQANGYCSQPQLLLKDYRAAKETDLSMAAEKERRFSDFTLLEP